MGASTFSGSIRSVAGVDFISSKDAATDLGIDRQSSTVLEVNNGTPVADGGAYRDLKVRTLTATGLSSQETIVATTSVTTPLVTNAGTLALSATGANIITLSTNGSERARITSGGNVLVGTTTDGNYKLDVASSGPSGTLRVYDQTATTGFTSLVVRAGAGQSSSNLTTWQDNSANTLAAVTSGGIIHGSSLAASQGTGGTETSIEMRKASSISASNVLYTWSHRSNDTDLWLHRFDGTTYTNLLKFLYNGGTDQIQFAPDGAQISFFGVTPVARPAAPTGADNSALNTGDATSDAVIGNMRTRLGEVVTALQNIGLLG